MIDTRDYRYLMPTDVHFGLGAFDRLGKLCAGFGERPLLITGRKSARRTGLLDRASALLPRAVIFDDIEENPSTDTCDRAAARCREEGCDVVVAIGGGSPMDAAKAVAGLALHPFPCAEAFTDDPFPRGMLPIVAVPTTAGTGSEVTPYSVLVDTARRRKATIKGPGLFPKIALLDPELTRSMPRDVTVATGLDVLSQAMEGMVSRKSTAVGDILALETCRLVAQWLPRAARDGDDLEARAAMLHAAMLSGCVIAQSGTTLVHGMGYYYTLECGIPHGLANGLFLIPVFRYNAGFEPARVAALAAALGVPAATESRAARDAVTIALERLFAACGVSPAARHAGVDPDQVRRFARDCAAEPHRFRNQVGEPGEDDVLRFYLESYSGVWS